MPRRPRDDAPGVIHHVVARGNNRGLIVLDDADRMALLRRLRTTVDRFGLVVHAYCVMNNHVHLIVQSRTGTLGREMQFLLGGYAHGFNRRHDRTGHLIEGPFHSRVLRDESYLLTASAYVVLNPVRARMCEQPRDFFWSSYRATVGEARDPVICPSSLVLDLLSTDLPFARRMFRAFVDEQIEVMAGRRGQAEA